ncbi:hypothetical protein Rsub_09891 [Raphidocelis subcapitata]|uniref:GATA-type domain-containing protein n=1 Tax=Raphidocelis subcapitata TaxID=307507 RepID=A0A2V0PAK7_9CHLO|nr:hypothetical protein Rsub_09891 [Raphidocelis subcapitata]|eukprot:GBF96886.1 hypothetical protein Rsub_09891 [Raphidocelis subcapitata]
MDTSSLIGHALQGGGLAALCDFEPCTFDASAGLNADSFAPDALPGARWPPEAGGIAAPHQGRGPPHLAAAGAGAGAAGAGAHPPPCVPLAPLAVVTPSPLASVPPAASGPTDWGWPTQHQLQAAAAQRQPRALTNAARELLFQEAEAIAGSLVLCEPGGSAGAFGRAASPELLAAYWAAPAAQPPAPSAHAPRLPSLQQRAGAQAHAGGGAAAGAAVWCGNEASSSSTSSVTAEEALAAAAAPGGPHAGFGGAASAAALAAGLSLSPSIASRVRTPTKRGGAAAAPELRAPRADQRPRPRGGQRRAQPQMAAPAAQPAGGAGAGLCGPSPGEGEAVEGAQAAAAAAVAGCGAPQQGAPCSAAGRGAPKAPLKRRAPHHWKGPRAPKRRPPIKLPARNPGRSLRCGNCGTAVTPQWRRGPDGPKTLCNSCGVRYQRGLPLWITDGQEQQQPEQPGQQGQQLEQQEELGMQEQGLEQQQR